MMRTEEFLKYVEEHPEELLEAIGDKTDALVRELEERERQAARSARRSSRLSSDAPRASQHEEAVRF